MSHRLNRRVRGALHAETFYSKPRVDETGKSFVHKRLALRSLSPKDVANIVDPAVRRLVEERLDVLRKKPAEAFADEKNLPVFEGANGHSSVVKRVRVRQNLTTTQVGAFESTRNVQTGSNHHMAVFAIVDDDGKTEKWESDVITLLEAHRRLRSGRPIVDRAGDSNRKFLFSLAGGDIIELVKEAGTRSRYVVRTVSERLRFIAINDGRRLVDIGTKAGQTANAETLRRWKCQKVVITPLGDVRWAND